jgi:hypothetical protein
VGVGSALGPEAILFPAGQWLLGPSLAGSFAQGDDHQDIHD